MTEQSKGRGSGSIRIGDANAILKYVAFTALGLVASQFLPLVTGAATNKTEMAQVKSELSALRTEMRAGFADIKSEVREQVGLHDQKTAHEGALQMLLRHGEGLSEQKAKVEAHARRPHP